MTRRIGRLRQRCALLGRVGCGSVDNVSRRSHFRQQGPVLIRFAMFPLLSTSHAEVWLLIYVQLSHCAAGSTGIARKLGRCRCCGTIIVCHCGRLLMWGLTTSPCKGGRGKSVENWACARTTRKHLEIERPRQTRLTSRLELRWRQAIFIVKPGAGAW